MSKIQISNLQPAGAELFQGGESFLTDLQATEAHRIHGGGSKSKKKGGTTVVVVTPPIVYLPYPYPYTPPVPPHTPPCPPPPHC
jgi:hypothetical protein